MRDRLIELLKQKACHYVLCDNECGGCKNVEMYDDSIESIADHLLANGVIVPPVKVGQTVYFIDHDFDVVFKGKLVSYSLDAAHLWFNCHYESGLNMWHTIERFGKDVFLTREEAETALKGE